MSHTSTGHSRQAVIASGAVLALILLIPSPALAETIPMRTDHTVAGVDGQSGYARWTWRHKGNEINFAVAVKEGILVGTDNAEAILLDAETGAVRWTTKIAHAKAVNNFNGAFNDGYLVSQDSEQFWMIDPSGTVRWTRTAKD